MCFSCVISFYNSNRKCSTYKFQKTLKVHFNQNVFPEIISYLLSVMGLLPFMAIIFQSSFFLRRIKSESSLPCMCHVCTALVALHPPRPHFSEQPSNGLLGKVPVSSIDNFGWRGHHHLLQRWANNLSYQSITFPWPHWLGQMRLSIGNSDPKDTNLKRRLELLQLLCTITGKSIYRWSQHRGNQA